MVINNLDILRSALSPDEADSPLIVDSDAVQPLSAAAQSFEPVSRNGRNVCQGFCVVEQTQFSTRDIAELPVALALEQFLGVPAAGGADHTESISRHQLNDAHYTGPITPHLHRNEQGRLSHSFLFGLHLLREPGALETSGSLLSPPGSNWKVWRTTRATDYDCLRVPRVQLRQ